MSYPCSFSSCNLSPDAVLVCSPPDFFVVLSCHFIFRMYLGHLLMNICSIRVVVLVALHVLEPYSSTLVTLVLKILILFRVKKDDVFHTVFKILNACLAFPIRLVLVSFRASGGMPSGPDVFQSLWWHAVWSWCLSEPLVACRLVLVSFRASGGMPSGPGVFQSLWWHAVWSWHLSEPLVACRLVLASFRASGGMPSGPGVFQSLWWYAVWSFEGGCLNVWTLETAYMLYRQMYAGVRLRKSLKVASRATNIAK